MATKKTPETTVRVETVGVNEIADAVAERIGQRIDNVARSVDKVDDKVNRHYHSTRSTSGRARARIKRLEAQVGAQDKDIDTLFKMVSEQQPGVTVTRHRNSRGD